MGKNTCKCLLHLVAACVVFIGAPVEGALVFVPDALRSEIVVVDPVSDRILATLPSARPSRNVATNAAQSRLYVADTGWLTSTTDTQSTITVWDLPSSDGIVDAASPSGAFLKKAAVVGLVHVGVAPMDLVLNGAESRLYVANAGDGTISVVDPSEMRVETTFSVGGRLMGIAFHPMSGRMYVTRSDTNELLSLDQFDGTVLSSVAVGLRPTDVALTPDGTLAIVANIGDDTVSIVDVNTNHVSRTVHVGRLPASVSMTKTGDVFVAELASASVSKLDVERGSLQRTVSVAHGIGALAVDGTGKPYALSFKQGDVYRYDASFTKVGTVMRRSHIPAISNDQVGH